MFSTDIAKLEEKFIEFGPSSVGADLDKGREMLKLNRIIITRLQDFEEKFFVEIIFKAAVNSIEKRTFGSF